MEPYGVDEGVHREAYCDAEHHDRDQISSRVNDAVIKRIGNAVVVDSMSTGCSGAINNDTSDGHGPEYSSDHQAYQLKATNTRENNDRSSNAAFEIARECIKTGKYSTALNELINVVAIANINSLAYRQCLLLCAQVLRLTLHFDACLSCLLEIYRNMPPPYTVNDAQLIIVCVYKMKGCERLAAFWNKKCFRGECRNRFELCTSWRLLAGKCAKQMDFVFAMDASDQALRLVGPDTFFYSTETYRNQLQTIYIQLAAVLEVTVPHVDCLFSKQQVAFNLADEISEWLDCHTIEERLHDPYYAPVRAIYFENFPSIYSNLFSGEDAAIDRISRAWRRFRSRSLQAHAVQKKGNPGTQKKTTKVKSLSSLQKEDGHPITKPRNASFRGSVSQTPLSTFTAERTDSIDRHENLSTFLMRNKSISRYASKKQMENSPTRRKINTVRHMRQKPTLDTIQQNNIADHQDDNDRAAIQFQNELSVSSFAPTLLDIYSFPDVSDANKKFEQEAGRIPGAADLDLSQIEEFARMAHYRSRVLMRSQLDVNRLHEEAVTPTWLNDLSTVVRAIEEHPQKKVNGGASTAHYFTEIHARVIFQLNKLQKRYFAQYGKSLFSDRLTACIKLLREWKFKDPAEIVQWLQEIRECGIHEEKHRNLEFYHVHALAARMASDGLTKK